MRSHSEHSDLLYLRGSGEGGVRSSTPATPRLGGGQQGQCQGHRDRGLSHDSVRLSLDSTVFIKSCFQIDKQERPNKKIYEAH